MSGPKEIKIKVSNDEQKYSKRFLCYDAIQMDQSDPKLKSMVEEAVSEFKGGVDYVRVVVNMEW